MFSSVSFTFSSVSQSCLALCDPMDCSTPGFPVHQQLPELAQTHVHRCHPTISSSVVPSSSCLQSFPALGSFPVNQFLMSGGQRVEFSASASVLPMNIQDQFPLGLTGLISVQSKRLKSLLWHRSSQASVLQHSAFSGPTLTSVHDYWKNHSFD